jgi:transcriptional repressor NrdR
VRCPYCRHADSRVVDSREADDGQLIRRRRSCPECGKRFTTVEEAVLAVVKRSGVTEPFSRTKIMSGVRKACQGRPVDEDSIALLAQKVEETVRARGLAILVPLRDLDQVAYLRFASVYKAFDSLDEFEREITELRAARTKQTGPDEAGSASEPGGKNEAGGKHVAAGKPEAGGTTEAGSKASKTDAAGSSGAGGKEATDRHIVSTRSGGSRAPRVSDRAP